MNGATKVVMDYNQARGSDALIFAQQDFLRIVVAKPSWENDMKTTAGLWISHRKAVITIVSPNGEETMKIGSDIDQQPGHLAGARSSVHYESQNTSADGSRDRCFMKQLHRFYDVVIAVICSAEAILIFGPGEAKGELKKRLNRAKLGEHVVAMETADKMTDRQIKAKVREFFRR
jgi:hypothetical protein